MNDDDNQWRRPMMMSGRGRISEHNRSELSDQNRLESMEEANDMTNVLTANDGVFKGSVNILTVASSSSRYV